MRHLLLLAILLFVTVSYWSLQKVGRQKNFSISLHVAQTKYTQIVFGGCVVSAASLAALTFFRFLLPHYDANIIAYVLYAIIVADFFVIGLVPYFEHSWRGTLHNTAAWGMVYTIPLTMLIAQLWRLTWMARLGVSLMTFLAIVLLLLVVVRREKYRPIFLYFQIAYLMAFFGFLLIINYL